MTKARSTYYFVTIVYNAVSGNVINVFAMEITSVSFLVSKQALRCQRGRLNVSFFLWKANNYVLEIVSTMSGPLIGLKIDEKLN